MGIVRFLLALWVVAGHSPGGAILGIQPLSGATAVQCFYAISGFLITMVLNERKEYGSALNFYLSRYLRLWPTYILVAGATLVFFRRDQMLSTLPDLVNWPGLAFVAFSNLTLFFQDWFLFLRIDHGALVPTSAFGLWPEPQLWSFLLVPPCWTLGVELTFYAIAPFVARRWWSIAALFAFGAAVRLIVAALHPVAEDPWSDRFAPSEMMMFAAGGLAYFLGRSFWPRFPRFTAIACSAAIAIFVAVTLGGQSLAPWIGASFPEVDRVLLLVNSPMLLLIVVAAGPLFYGTRRSRIDQMVGELSYPMYVSHFLVFHAFASYGLTGLGDGNLLYVLCVIAASTALVFAITLPVDRIRKNFGARIPQIAPVPRQPGATTAPATTIAT